MPNYYASSAFRYAGIDYRQGPLNLPASVGDALVAAGFVVAGDVPDGGAFPLPTGMMVLYGTYASRPAASPALAGRMYVCTDRYLGAPAFCDGTSWISYGVPDRPMSQVAASRNIASTDDGVRLISTSATAVTLTIPSGLPAGFQFRVTQEGAGKVSIVAGSGATVNAQAAKIATAAQYATIEILQSFASTDSYTVTGQSGT